MVLLWSLVSLRGWLSDCFGVTAANEWHLCLPPPGTPQTVSRRQTSGRPSTSLETFRWVRKFWLYPPPPVQYQGWDAVRKGNNG